ncbi:unnamed protein product [Sphagnum compactum]
MLVDMRSMGWSIILVIFVMMAQTLSFTASEDCSPLCATTCDINGNCICAQYPNSTGAIHFLGGEYCNQSSYYCNGSASPFWCAVNGLNNTCSRAPDGNFTCSCRAGFSGEHCELSGTACGDGYCYNGAACTGGGICDCPDDWQGSANCSISTPEDLHSSGHHVIKWWGALLLTGAIVAALSLLAVAAVKKYRERREGINRFKELQKSQMRGRPESDDDEYDSDPEEVAKRNAKK